MSQFEHPAISNMRNYDVAEGEVTEVTATGITIAGSFNPGLAVTLHPGARVFVLTEDDVINLTRH